VAGKSNRKKEQVKRTGHSGGDHLKRKEANKKAGVEKQGPRAERRGGHLTKKIWGRGGGAKDTKKMEGMCVIQL